MLEELKNIRKIITSDIEDVPISKMKLVLLSLKLGVKNLYIGNRYRHDSYRGVFVVNKDNKTIIPDAEGGEVSLFKHEEYDYFYYDLLDKKARCERVDEGVLYARNACCNLENVEDRINHKTMVKRRIKK